MFDNMPDINLDVPNAYVLLERFGDMCQRDGVMDPHTYRDLPRGYVYLTFVYHMLNQNAYLWPYLIEIGLLSSSVHTSK